MKANCPILTDKTLEAFVSFSTHLYEPAYQTENQTELRALLTTSHPLSHYFQVIPIWVVEDDHILARAVLSLYPDDDAAYLGYFESENNPEAARLLFEEAVRQSRLHQKKQLEGPMNASFWLGYRLKTNHFNDQPYFSESYQPDYYQQLWEANSFKRTDRYFSNHYAPVDEQMSRHKYAKRYRQFQEKGYMIKSPSRATLDQDFAAVAELIQDRFKSFPVFKQVSPDEFISLFSNLKLILRKRYVKLAYTSAGEMVGFIISVPDYGNLFNRKQMTVKTLLSLVAIKCFSRRYIVMYMAVKEGHEGLGSAMVYALMTEYNKRRIQATSSYIHEGKVSGSYVFGSVERQSEYAYYVREVDDV